MLKTAQPKNERLDDTRNTAVVCRSRGSFKHELRPRRLPTGGIALSRSRCHLKISHFGSDFFSSDTPASVTREWSAIT